MQTNGVTTWYRVAEHLFGVNIAWGEDARLMLPSYTPFLTTPAEGEEPMFVVNVIERNTLSEVSITKQLAENINDLGRWILHSTKEGFCLDLQYETGYAWHRMIFDTDFKNITIAIERSDLHANNSINSLTMMAFAQTGTAHSTLLVHSSVVIKDGIGYAFLGKSGTGKSTHSRLWLQNIEGTELLNDDNPAVRIHDDGEIYIYGTPWSGKTHCYKAERYELRGCVRISQAPANSIKKLPLLRAYGSIHPSCPPDFAYDNHLYDHVSRIIGKILTAAQFYHLECLPDKAAALLSCKTIFHDKQ
jgi:hypothetical protein